MANIAPSSLSERLASMEEMCAEMKTIQYALAEKFASMSSAQEDILQLSQDLELKSTKTAVCIEDLTCHVSRIQCKVEKQEQASHRCMQVMDKVTKVVAPVVSPRQDDNAASKLQTLPVLPVKHDEDDDAASVISVTTEA